MLRHQLAPSTTPRVGAQPVEPDPLVDTDGQHVVVLPDDNEPLARVNVDEILPVDERLGVDCLLRDAFDRV